MRHQRGTPMKKTDHIIITSLDGTLLDARNNSLVETQVAIAALEDADIPLIFCSGRTSAEVEWYRSQVDNRHPYIVEDGAAVFIPRKYFREPIDQMQDNGACTKKEFGVSYARIKDSLAEVAHDTGISLTGFGDLTAEEIAAETGLDRGVADRAKARAYSEILLDRHDFHTRQRLRDSLKEHRLRLFEGVRYEMVTGAHDKGAAVSFLIGQYVRENPHVQVIGIGSSQNDAPFLASVDRPVLVQKSGGHWEDLLVANLERIPQEGPAGWKKFALDFLSEIPQSGKRNHARYR